MASKIRIKCEICTKRVGFDYFLSSTRDYREHCKQMHAEKKKRRKNFKHNKIKTADKELRELVFKRDKKRCAKCGCKYNLQAHHKIPRSEGGLNTINNLITLCDVCHMEEHRGEVVYNIMIKRLFVYETIKESG